MKLSEIRPSSLFVTYMTLTVLLTALYAVKLCLLFPLISGDFDVYGSYEAGYMVFGWLPSLISAAGIITLDIKIIRRLTVRTISAVIAAEALCLLELIPVLFYWLAAISSLAGLVAAGLIIYEHATYKKREARRKRIEAARERAKNSARTAADGGRHKKKRKKGDTV